ncbi:acetylornithine deacetylase [Lichenifustis flavocetrariae]|uniref:Acetylornithine deacetylase n=1 Tax=Lichenifustis flavocetrariae TaxID=2949735 RepID=A0AA41YWA7_9HYPH|nr:acetylornithine deacetylase [Lichenifustis flavocetrariae]MCW6508411.1 acetylornithine deacetylase [Lichenifustis flavocetrariae]
MTTLELLDRLVAFPTVSRDPNRALIEFVRHYLAARGVQAELFEAEAGRKANLFATVGPADIPGILLSGHTDVVPVDGQPWTTDPFRLTLDDGRAFGRGTTDMKGFLAAALRLVDHAAQATLRTPIHLAFSHDEETGCVGVRPMLASLAARGLQPRLAIVGEPTSMRIATGHKGKIGARATCCGVAAHSALAPRALNAIHLACDFVAAVRTRQDDLAREGARDPDYDVPYSTLHVGRIAGGTALNIVPDRCTIDFEIRNIAEDDSEAILGGLMDAAAAISDRNRRAFPQADIRIEVFNRYPGLATPPDAEVVRFVEGLVDEPETSKVAFGTEGGLFTEQLGVPVVVCGPGSMDQGHKADEFIALDQLEACDRMMERLLKRCL